jgi:phosphoglycerol transferase
MQPLRALTRLIDETSRVPRWIDALFAALLCVAAGITAMGAWHADLTAPYLSGGDADATQYMIKTVLEHGWYTRNPDVGAPFGATMYDFPIPEPTNFGLIWILGLFVGDPFVVYNLFYLLSFATAGLAAWWGFRRLGIDRSLAIVGAFLFSMLFFHFIRLVHLFLASYFSAAIFATYATRLAMYRLPYLSSELRLSAGTALFLALAAGAGVYYAFFGCLLIAAGGAMGWTGSRRREPLLLAGGYVAIIVAVIALSLAPNALYHLAEGANPLVANRQASDAEIYGLRITQLLLPPYTHRLHLFADLARQYNASAPLVNENTAAALGTLGSLGLIAAIGFALLGERSRFPLVAALGGLAICAILFATMGGFGALFALLITPDIRALNRISVFIAFFALATTLILVQRACGSRPAASAFVALLIGVIGWYDQTPVAVVPRNLNSAPFHAEQAFFRKVQNMLPQGSAVYELPYMFFPEGPKAGSLTSYDLMKPYLQTSGLRWSFGDMHGRASDIWSEKVSALAGGDLVKALASAGFSAIYLNRAGYADRTGETEKNIKQVLGPPSLEDPSHDLVLYKIPSTATPTLPFVVVAPGRGWYPWQKDVHQSPFGQAKGSADFMIANPGAASHITVKFTVISRTRRDLRVNYDDERLGNYDLKINVPTRVELTFVAPAGLSRITLDTGTVGLDPLDFRVESLAYAATALE